MLSSTLYFRPGTDRNLIGKIGMGARRKTYTYTLDERKSKVGHNSRGSRGGNFRGLNKADLAGVIFGCSQQTFKECVTQLIFGLPAPHFGYVQNIGLRMPLFLFNYSDRKLHGTFEAASPGQMNINPYSWTEGGAEKTQFPAQVRVCIRQHCEPLSEFAFRNAISSNYYTNTHFWFELDHSQVDALMSLFLSRTINRYSEINFQKVSEVGVLQSKKVPSYFSVWQTSSSGTLQDSAEIGLEGTNSGDWTMVSQKGKDLSYGKVDAWQESSESSSQDDENCKNIASTAMNSDIEKEVSGDLTNKRTSPVLLDNKSESVGRGSTSKQLVANGSDGNLELLVLEKLKRLATKRQNSSNSPKSDTSVKDFNNNTTIAGPLQKVMEQMQQEMAELRYYAEQTRNGFPNAMEIKELRNKNALLEQKQFAPTGEPTQKAGQVECQLLQFYLRGTCKFGTMCKFEHSNQKEECGGETQFNFLGLPIRRGEKECSYYIRTGSCKYGVTCRFHHPEPASEATTISVSNSPMHVTAINSLPSSSETSYSTEHPSWSLPRAPYDSNIHSQQHGTYMHAMTPMPAWSNNYQSSVNPLSSLEGKQYPMDSSLMNTQTNGPSSNSAQAISALGSRPFGVQPTVTVMEREGSLERPGHPECPHYLKNGYCTLGAFCRFHHPKRTEQSGPINSLSSEMKQYPVGIDSGNNITQLNDLARNTQGSVFLTPKPISSATMALPSIQSQVPVLQKRTFPQRPGHSECQYYMKTGDCKFGEACRYHHPKEKLQQSSACMLNPTSLPMHYVQNPFLMPEENQHNTGISIATRQPSNLTTRDVSSVHNSTESIYSASIQVPPVQSQDFATQRETFPDRPGQPECQYYMKTGDCKFGAACRFHHPKENSEKLPAYKLSGTGLPSHPVTVSKSI